MLALATELAILDRIYYAGFVEGARKQQLLSDAMALVLPSYSENFGNVVLEAMATAVPVVVTPEVGLSSVVANTQSGIVSPGDTESLSAAIRSLVADAQLRARLGENGRRAAIRYSWDTVAERMEQEYRSLLPRDLG